MSSNSPRIKIPSEALQRLRAIQHAQSEGFAGLALRALISVINNRAPNEVNQREMLPHLDFTTPCAPARYGTLTSRAWEHPNFFRIGMGTDQEELAAVTELVAQSLNAPNTFLEELGGGAGAALFGSLREILAREETPEGEILLRGAATRDLNPYSIQAGNLALPEELRPHVLVAIGDVMAPLISIAHDGPTLILAHRLITVLDHTQTGFLFENISQGLNPGDRLVMSYLLPEGNEFEVTTRLILLKRLERAYQDLCSVARVSKTIEEFRDNLITSNCPRTESEGRTVFHAGEAFKLVFESAGAQILLSLSDNREIPLAEISPESPLPGQIEALANPLTESLSFPSLEELTDYLEGIPQRGLEEVETESVFRPEHNHRIVLRGDGEISTYYPVNDFKNAPVEELEGKESLQAVCNTFRTPSAFRDQAQRHGFEVNEERQIGDLMVASLTKKE